MELAGLGVIAVIMIIIFLSTGKKKSKDAPVSVKKESEATGLEAEAIREEDVPELTEEIEVPPLQEGPVVYIKKNPAKKKPAKKAAKKVPAVKKMVAKKVVAEDLSKMSKAELLAKAKKDGIKVSSRMKKADILLALT